MIGRKAVYYHKGVSTQSVFKVTNATRYKKDKVNGYSLDMVVHEAGAKEYGLKVGTKYHLDHKYVKECFKLIKQGEIV